MSRLAAALVALSLGACTTTNIGSAVSAVTTGFQNPVGKQELATVEASYGAVLTAAVTYRRLCIAKQYVVVGENCRDTVAKMQNARGRGPGVERDDEDAFKQSAYPDDREQLPRRSRPIPGTILLLTIQL